MEKYTLAPYVTFGFLGEQLRCGSGSLQRFITDPTLHEYYLRVAHFFKTPHTLQEAQAEFADFPEGYVHNILQEFVSSPLLIQYTEYASTDRYSRHALYYCLSGAHPQSVQQRLGTSHIVLLGCGGIGNVLGLLLVCAGIGRITLVDEDRIELSNLTRQVLFTEADIGRSKLEVAGQTLQARNTAVTIDLLPKWIRSTEDLADIPQADLWVLSADKPRQLVHWVNAYCVAHSQPYIPVGYVQDIAVWGPLVIPGETGCFACQDLVGNASGHALLDAINAGYQTPSCGPVNMLSASAAALDILRYLGKYGEIRAWNKRMGIFSHDMHIESQDCSKNAHCRVCTRHLGTTVAEVA